MATKLTIQSHKGSYTVDQYATVRALAESVADRTGPATILIDERVLELYRDALAPLVQSSSQPAFRVVAIAATENNKSLARMESHVEALVEAGSRRNHTLIAIGGGIIQDIACFVASTLYRGMAWELVPTTLLAQADSCIGSKSSINVGRFKNLMGTFTPPNRIHVSSEFLKTLSDADIRSGIGEILKVHILAGPAAFEDIITRPLRVNSPALDDAIWSALSIKKRYIEEDEFDRGIRNVLNYGHTFGHAIESATHFAVPHGIAVTIGMDLANHVSAARQELPVARRDAMRRALMSNAGDAIKTNVPIAEFLAALRRDKKNEGNKLAFILLDQQSVARKVFVDDTPALHELCTQYFAELQNTA